MNAPNRAADTDWARIAALYDRLRVVAPSRVVDLNRAIAHSMAFGPDAGLGLLDELDNAAALRDYAPLPAARGDFLFRAGRLAEAGREFTAAAALTRNARERSFLLARADACNRRAQLSGPGSACTSIDNGVYPWVSPAAPPRCRGTARQQGVGR